MTDQHFFPELRTAPSRRPCAHCAAHEPLGFSFSMAFQPIVDVHTAQVFAYEALVRGTDGASAQSVLQHVNASNRYRFDQQCRRTAIELAAQLGVDSALSINFMPNAVYEPSNCLRASLAAARRHDFPFDKLIFEVTEHEQVMDPAHLRRIIQEYRQHGVRTAMDDFGAGYSGLNLLAALQPDLVKLDRELIAGVDRDRGRQTILTHALALCEELGIDVIAEGVETEAEFRTLYDAGVRLMQGFLLARPAFEALPSWSIPLHAMEPSPVAAFRPTLTEAAG